MIEFRRAILALNICAGLVCLSSAEAQVSQAEQRRRLPRDHELTIQWALARSGAVVRAEVISTDPMAYDAQNDEAFTHVILNIVDVVAGSEELLGEMELFLRGGVLPNGSVRYIADLPMLVEGETCVLFLKDGDYNITPFAIWHVFREVTLEGEDILVDEHGRVVEFHEDGRITFAERTLHERTTFGGAASVTIRDHPSRGQGCPRTDCRIPVYAPTDSVHCCRSRIAARHSNTHNHSGRCQDLFRRSFDR